MPTISLSELGRHWKISKQAVAKHVKKGCPLSSIAAADKWRDGQGQRRSGKPEDAAPAKGKPGRPKLVEGPARTGDSLHDALLNAIMVSDKAYEFVQKAMVSENDPRLSIRLAIHSKALDTRFDAEKRYREESERRGQLIDFNKASETFRRGFDFILSRMRKIPQTHAARCNPQNPTMALGVLENAISSLVEAAQTEYAAN